MAGSQRSQVYLPVSVVSLSAMFEKRERGNALEERKNVKFLRWKWTGTRELCCVGAQI